MLFETEPPGDTIAAPICLTNDREDALSRNRVDSHSDQADAEPTAVLLEDWRDTVIKPAAGCSAPSSQRQLPRAGGNTDTAPADFARWRACINSIASIVAELWSRMRRERQIRRIGAAWGTIDDRTLKDIGISRYEIEYARDPRYGSYCSRRTCGEGLTGNPARRWQRSQAVH
jgi:uncharacterized protein YjiS (DUF1127 family)